MLYAFVLVNCHFPFDPRIIEQLSMMQHVLAVHRTEGRYDLLVKLSAETETKLREVISHQIDKIQGVDATISLFSTDTSK